MIGACLTCGHRWRLGGGETTGELDALSPVASVAATPDRAGANASDLLLSFVGDDFTGSTDAMEALTRAGLRTVLFLRPPAPQDLAAFPGVRAVGVAGASPALPPGATEAHPRPRFAVS